MPPLLPRLSPHPSSLLRFVPRRLLHRALFFIPIIRGPNWSTTLRPTLACSDIASGFPSRTRSEFSKLASSVGTNSYLPTALPSPLCAHRPCHPNPSSATCDAAYPLASASISAPSHFTRSSNTPSRPLPPLQTSLAVSQPPPPPFRHLLLGPPPTLPTPSLPPSFATSLPIPLGPPL